MASYLKSEGERAANGCGAQGGTTVANSRRVGLLWLNEKLQFPIEVDNIVAIAAANPGQVREYRRADPASRKRKQSGSLPIQCYLQIETLANAKEESPTRFFARSLLAFSMLQSVRPCSRCTAYSRGWRRVRRGPRHLRLLVFFERREPHEDVCTGHGISR